MVKTRKELITEQYLILLESLKIFDGNDEILPALNDEVDIKEVIILINLFFPKNGEEEYITTIHNFIREKDIVLNSDELSTVTKLILNFINFLYNI